MRYVTAPQSPIPFLKPGHVKTKRQDKLKHNAFLCFFIGPSANCPRDSYELILYSENVVNSRNVTWARLPSPFAASTENVHLDSVRGEGKGSWTEFVRSGGWGCGHGQVEPARGY